MRTYRLTLEFETPLGDEDLTRQLEAIHDELGTTGRLLKTRLKSLDLDSDEEARTLVWDALIDSRPGRERDLLRRVYQRMR